MQYHIKPEYKLTLDQLSESVIVHISIQKQLSCKKSVQPQKESQGEKRCEIKEGGQEMAVCVVLQVLLTKFRY